VEDKKGRLWLNFVSRREFGIYDPKNYQYTKVTLEASKEIPVRSEYKIWKDHNNDIFLTAQGYGIFKYDEKKILSLRILRFVYQMDGNHASCF
jgi:hypothetical protein